MYSQFNNYTKDVGGKGDVGGRRGGERKGDVEVRGGVKREGGVEGGWMWGRY